MKRLLHLSSYFFLRIVCFLLMILPLRFTYFLARFTGCVAFQLFRFRRRVVLDNLKIAFDKEMDESQLTELAAESYKQVAMTFLELLISPKMEKQIKNMLAPEQRKIFHELLNQNHGLVAVSGHLGNWELQGAAASTAMKEPFAVAAVQQSNPYINHFITGRRNALGMRVAGTKEAMKLLVDALKNKQAIGLVADQNATWSPVYVDFFGKTAATMPGPAQFALRYNAPMIVAAAVRTGPGQFKVLLQQVDILENDTVETLTQRHVKILEGFIRKYPEQYFWLHRRWKTRPPEERQK